MGGNVQVLSKGGEMVSADKINLKSYGRQKFIKDARELFLALNTIAEATNNRKIWPDESIILNSIVYNGSSSFALSQDFEDRDILGVKPNLGDIDIAVPKERNVDLFGVLEKLQGKRVTQNVSFVGMNRTNIKSLGTQINAVFKFSGEVETFVQVDFEFLEFENSAPTEWARFSHSSSFEDAKIGVKAVHHKYLLRAMIGAMSVRPDIVVATPKSSPDNVKLSKKDEVVRMLKFSVDHGVRIAYSPFLREDGSQVYYGNKRVYKEIPTKDSTYEKTLEGIFSLVFGEPNSKEVKELWTFEGLIKLIKRHLKPAQIEETKLRYFEMLWGSQGQKLVRGDAEEDAEIKSSGWVYFIDKLGLSNPPQFEQRLEHYYANY